MQDLEKINDIEGLSNFIAEKQKELQAELVNKETVEVEKYNLQLEILKLQRQTKDRQIAKIEIEKSLNTSVSNCRKLILEVSRAEKKFWRLKNP